MKIVKWLLGLFQTWYISWYTGLALAMLLVQWTWFDMRSNAGAVIAILLIVLSAVYILNTIFKLYNELFWLKWKISEVFIWASVFMILATNMFDLDRLAVVPANVIKSGLPLPLPEALNIWLVVMWGVGYVLHLIYQRISGEQVSLQQPIQLTDKRKRHINLIIALTTIFLAFYFLHVEFQVFINSAATRMMEADIEAFKNYLLSFGLWAPIISAFLMIFSIVMAPPIPGFVITFTNGLLFGTLWGGLLSWSSAMVGSALCFYISRSLGRPAIEKMFSKRALDWMDQFFKKYGIHSILLARLVPVISFDLVSYAAGLTSIRFWVYFIATGIGQAPATIVYSYLGQHASDSVMYLFYAFIIVTALAVLAAAFKPYFDKKMKKGVRRDAETG
jgi:uncharacterized membrane protein YdjX (TVP38/TMEM64 family)